MGLERKTPAKKALAKSTLSKQLPAKKATAKKRPLTSLDRNEDECS